MLPLPTALPSAANSNHGEPYAAAPAPDGSSQATSAASQPLAVTYTNGWQATDELVAELPGLGPDSSADKSVRKRSRWSDAQPEQAAPRYEAPEAYSAPQVTEQTAPMPAQDAHRRDRPQIGSAHTQWEGGAGASSVQDGYLPPPPPVHQQQQTGDRAGASGNGVVSSQAAPPGPQAAAVMPGSDSAASRPARRSRWESAPAAEPTAGGIGARAPAQQQLQMSQQMPAAPPARPALAAPPVTPQASKPVWTGEGAAPWLVAQEAAAEARRAAQGATTSSQQSATPGMAPHQQGANPGSAPPPASSMQSQHQAAMQMPAPRPGAAAPQHHLQQQQQSQQHGRPSGLAPPRLGPPPPAMMRPMAGPPPPQHHPQQLYGMAPPMAFFPGGGHMHPGHMHPGQLAPGHMHPGFAPGPMHGMPPRPWPPQGPRPPPGQPSGAGTIRRRRPTACTGF